MGKAARWFNFKGLFGLKKDKDKKWGSSVKSGGGDSAVRTRILVGVPSAAGSEWLRSFISDSEKEQDKHAIAVVAATAAAADAAVAAAQAAAAVVRLTSQGRGGLSSGGRERWAALKIQNVFRGYLARKALRALKGLVKLQALVRGCLVRKRTAATLHGIQTLIRSQVANRTHRSMSNEWRFRVETVARKPIDTFDKSKSQSNSKRMSIPYSAIDECLKTVEIDTFRPKSMSWRMSHCVSDDQYYPMSSPLPYPFPIPSQTPIHHDYRHYEWGFVDNDYKFATAHNTPRFACSDRINTPMTPAKSVCGDSFFRQCPNYMSKTESFKAKLRSHSAPKQRDETAKNRLSSNEVIESRTSITCVRM